MIHRDLLFEGFDARSWTHLLALIWPDLLDDRQAEEPTSDDPSAEAGSSLPPEGTLVLIHAADGQLLKAHHTQRGRVVGLTFEGPHQLGELAATYGAARGVAVREGAMEELAEQLALRLQRGDEYLTQLLVLWGIVRELQDAGKLHFWPGTSQRIPVPPPGAVRRAMDLVLPNDRSISIGLWQGSALWTAAAIRRREGAIDQVLGPDRVIHWTGPLGGDWRRDHRLITSKVAQHVAPVHLGLYGEADTVAGLVKEAKPGAWARAVALREIIVEPAPVSVAVALAADAAHAAARSSARALGGLDVWRLLQPIGEYIRSRVLEITTVRAILGFDPLQALRETRQARTAQREQQGEPSPEPGAGGDEQAPDTAEHPQGASVTELHPKP